MRIARQQQKLLELVAKKFLARRIVEGQRRQGVQNPVGSGQAAVVSFNAEDGREVFRRDAALDAGFIERLAMRRPEFRALADAPLV